MWLSNTATTAMMYPIAMGVLAALSRLLKRGDGTSADLQRMRFGTALMLVCAYSSSIGGIGTPVGTPPNLIALGQLAELTGTRIPFFQWMAIALPIVGVMLVFAVLYFRFAFPPEVGKIEGSAAFIAEERGKLGAWKAGERNVLVAFLITASLWVLPGVAGLVLGADSPATRVLTNFLPESVVALLGAALLFVLPVSWSERRFTASWTDVSRIDWGTLLLFGGGLALGGAMFKTGLAEAVGHALTGLTGARSLVALTFLFSVFAIYFTEVTSNTATATMLVPLAIAAAKAAGVSPIEPAIGCAIGCSMAFMLPVATPPNAIVYGSGCVPIIKMVRAGFWFNIAASLIVPTGVLIMCHLLGV
jgi:sodium-dependent dicarboxylate transporter 2/3/5